MCVCVDSLGKQENIHADDQFFNFYINKNLGFPLVFVLDKFIIQIDWALNMS